MKRRPCSTILHTKLFSLLHCINYAFVFNECYSNIESIYNTERNHKRFIYPLKITVIKMHSGKEYSFGRFKKDKLQLLEKYTEVKAVCL
jgi:hypothetical protein